MKELSEIIERVSASDKSVEFLDLRKIIFPKLKDKSVSDYIPTSAVKVLLDVLLLKQRDEFDRKSADRGLFFTLDGVHLNSSGAEIVAESFLETIKSYERTKRD